MKVDLISQPSNKEIAAIAAAICTGTDKKDVALQHALESGHDSVIEHANFTFRITGVSRVLLAQMTRHRIASFSVESQRYKDPSDNGFFLPPGLNNHREEVEELLNNTVATYKQLVQAGVAKEDARYILPEAMTTSIIVTMNARELRHFFSLRCCNRAQWEIRDMADKMLRACKRVAPSLFVNAGPGCVRGRCPEGRMSCRHPREVFKDE